VLAYLAMTLGSAAAMLFDPIGLLAVLASLICGAQGRSILAPIVIFAVIVGISLLVGGVGRLTRFPIEIMILTGSHLIIAFLPYGLTHSIRTIATRTNLAGAASTPDEP
jgi:hypothetical protein